MEKSYGNIAVKGAAREALVAWLAAQGADAWIGPESDGWTAFAEASADAFDLARACEFMIGLTKDLGCVAVAAAIHNADVLGVLVVDRGRHVSSYISYPGIFAPDAKEEGLTPELIGAEDLLAALGSDMDEMEMKRRLGVLHVEQFLFPADLHAEFLRMFALPDYTLGFGYRRAEAGALPGRGDGFTRVPG